MDLSITMVYKCFNKHVILKKVQMQKKRNYFSRFYNCETKQIEYYMFWTEHSINQNNNNNKVG